MPASGSGGSAARARQLATQYNAEYERICAKWLVSGSSPLLKYLAEYKQFLLDEKIPNGEKGAESAKEAVRPLRRSPYGLQVHRGSQGGI